MTKHTYSGRVWTEARREPYTRKDGKATTLIVWTSPCCADGCTATAEVRTPTQGYEKSEAFGAKHCPAHKLTRGQVTERWAAAVKARRRAANSGVADLL